MTCVVCQKDSASVQNGVCFGCFMKAPPCPFCGCSSVKHLFFANTGSCTACKKTFSIQKEAMTQ